MGAALLSFDPAYDADFIEEADKCIDDSINDYYASPLLRLCAAILQSRGGRQHWPLIEKIRQRISLIEFYLNPYDWAYMVHDGPAKARLARLEEYSQQRGGRLVEPAKGFCYEDAAVGRAFQFVGREVYPAVVPLAPEINWPIL
jgi:hypothetical protein